MKSNSIGINKWAGGKDLELVWVRTDGSGNADNTLRGWLRSDGARAIETNGDPCFEHEAGFDLAWNS